MKYLVICIVALAFVACSSSGKKAEVQPKAPEQSAATQVAKDEAAKAEAEKLMDSKHAKKGKKGKKQKAEKVEKVEAQADGQKTAPVEKTGTKKITCKHGSDVRQLSIVDKEGGGCKVVYNKSGSESEIASATHNESACVEVYEKVQGKLQTSGYQCE